MFTFKQYLAESFLTEGKNVHLEHVEDEILNDGLRGARRALDALENVAGMLAGHSQKHYNLTAKWDGSPAIFAGTNPENGKFFVGTKAVFSKGTPKLVYSASDADKFYRDQPELANVLKASLKHLSKLGIKDVLQGDLMFGPGRMPKEQTIDGEEYITFKPNTITYAIPADSKLAERIRRAKIGIIFHTKYTGDAIQNLSSSFDVNVKQLKKTADVWYDDASYLDETGTVTLTAQETQEVRNHVINANKVLKTISEQELTQALGTKSFAQAIKKFINQRVRKGQHVGDTKKFVAELEEFLHQEIDKEKTQPGTKATKKQKTTQKIKQIHPTLLKVVEFINHVNEAKLELIGKLNKLNKIGTFLQTADGYKVTSPEGFVAVDHLTNKAVKLVDRLEFSRANFAGK